MSIFTRLSAIDRIRLKNSADIAQNLENVWAARMRGFLQETTEKVVASLERDGTLPEVDFERVFVEHSFQVAIAAMHSAHWDAQKFITQIHLAGPPKKKLPKDLMSLMRLYDLWKRGKYTPKRPAKIAAQVKREYLKKCRDVWSKQSKDFREGGVYNQEQVKKAIKKAAATTAARAQTIVRTETTGYYNEGRMKIYDQSQDVTHYLFIAVRDKATTKWCTAKVVDGKRGRHGLVYRKDDPLRTKERPACHWNCRSEMLPLSPLNPSHLRLIKDPSIQRDNVECHPLPHGWAS